MQCRSRIHRRPIAASGSHRLQFEVVRGRGGVIFRDADLGGSRRCATVVDGACDPTAEFFNVRLEISVSMSGECSEGLRSLRHPPRRGTEQGASRRFGLARTMCRVRRFVVRISTEDSRALWSAAGPTAGACRAFQPEDPYNLFGSNLLRDFMISVCALIAPEQSYAFTAVGAPSSRRS